LLISKKYSLMQGFSPRRKPEYASVLNISKREAAAGARSAAEKGNRGSLCGRVKVVLWGQRIQNALQLDSQAEALVHFHFTSLHLHINASPFPFRCHVSCMSFIFSTKKERKKERKELRSDTYSPLILLTPLASPSLGSEVSASHSTICFLTTPPKCLLRSSF